MGLMKQINPKHIQGIVAVEWPAWEPGLEPGKMLLSSWDGETVYLLVKLIDVDLWRKHHILIRPDWIKEAYIIDGKGKPISSIGWLRVIAFIKEEKET